jgi:hypothetical protein
VNTSSRSGQEMRFGSTQTDEAWLVNSPTSKEEREQHAYTPVHYTAVAWSLVICDWAQEQRGVLVGRQPSIQQHDRLLPSSVLPVLIAAAKLHITDLHAKCSLILKSPSNTSCQRSMVPPEKPTVAQTLDQSRASNQTQKHITAFTRLQSILTLTFILNLPCNSITKHEIYWADGHRRHVSWNLRARNIPSSSKG